MSFVSKLFGRGQQAESSEKQGLGSREAIQLARQGRIPANEMLGSLFAGGLFVPLSAPPEMNGESIKSWKPATVSKGDGSQWLVAFTDADMAAQFSKHNPSYSHGMRVDARWVLRTVPPDYGLVVNMGSPESMFEWNAEGLSRYKAEGLA
jgi:hypothetical protein